MNVPRGQRLKGELQGLIRDRRNKMGWIMENGRDQESQKTEIDRGMRKERIGTGSKVKGVKGQRKSRERKSKRSKGQIIVLDFD